MVAVFGLLYLAANKLTFCLLLDSTTIKRSLKRTSPHLPKQASPAKQRKLETPVQSSGEYSPRKRVSKHLAELESMNPGDDRIVNEVPAFGPAKDIKSWEEFEKVFDSYKKKHKLKFRVRSSEKTALYNSTHEDRIPTEFEWFQRIYRCTHEVSQASRSKGHRYRPTRYCNCKARLTAVVSRCWDNTYKIVVRNENHTQSHPTIGREASSYLTTKTLPLDDKDREDVMTLADARVSSSHIDRFLNDRLGM
ncbi:hypothetical protein PHMEG_00022903 [Phytophthora megakarya]|uniref:ZSWIM3 N-terminal domain-containing protein n=1 Tax=Phytophthora megakarya TaxID=4795 RepID=A0A225VI35_9STRA|nr:hypothetical protein PHMEG_00022903 [Phytophthora megakarya]